ncbi:hypothetical protein [Sphingorhabdus sp. M41]|uniref:hypothetical protein n=1 Tax=Sphingorhabdus sp. M41 TaxID=1806885 RepID=UPI00078CF872|nr:hypothetical protein [Sphingorhabdus sp. M41]AMO71943.1 hypothetical protein AZE99_08865 [Sphingorhabdus sp. M41]
MIKETLLFVAASGMLIYFISPSDEPPEVQPVEIEVQKPVESSVQTSDDNWDYDEGDEAEGDDDFVFGDPMISLDDNDGEISSDDVNAPYGQQQSGSKANSGGAFAGNREPATSANPRPGERGSIENPIEFKSGGSFGPEG